MPRDTASTISGVYVTNTIRVSRGQNLRCPGYAQYTRYRRYSQLSGELRDALGYLGELGAAAAYHGTGTVAVGRAVAGPQTAGAVVACGHGEEVRWGQRSTWVRRVLAACQYVVLFERFGLGA